MTDATHPHVSSVSRRRYDRERMARMEAEKLLEERSRALFEANKALEAQSDILRDQAAQLDKARARAEASNRAKSAFLATVSHELRTPMNAVLGLTTVLLEGDLSPRLRNMLKMIDEAAHLMSRIANDVLDLTRIEVAHIAIESFDFDARALFEDIARDYRERARNRGLDLSLELVSDVPATMTGDPVRIRQVISNLLSNAVKYTDAGSISLRLQWADDYLLATVCDTGPGIPDAHVAEVFQPFSRFGQTPEQREGSTGLGLTLARYLCRRMEGDLHYSDAEGGGACFVARMRIPGQTGDAGTAETRLPDTSADAMNDVFGLGRAIRVLAAEDNKTNQKVLQLLLKSVPVDLMMVADGRDAVEACAQTDYDLILMDIDMPVMDGITAAAHIHAHQRSHGRSPVPIIAVTANVMAHQLDAYARAGITAHVPKPVRKARLLSEMSRAVLAQTE